MMNFGAFRNGLGLEATSVPKRNAADMRETYKIVEEIGKGAYGTVVKALHRERQLYYAIKHIDTKAAGAKGLREVMNEVETMQLLSHPHIVHLEEVYQDDDNLWIVMEYVRGGELHAALKARPTGRFPEALVRRITFELLLALNYLHSKGIVHRDLKPANCLLQEMDGCADVKLADFGFAVMVGDNLCLTSYCGTMAYMAPEIVTDRNYGKPVDMWAVGVIVYLLLSGDYPFYAENSEQLPAIICSGQYSTASAIWADVSVGAKDFISKLLVTDDKKRLTAVEALRHYWLKNALAAAPCDKESDEEEISLDTSPNTAKNIIKAKEEGRRRRARLLFRKAAWVVLSAHRLVYLAKLHGLLRDGLDLPVARSFGFLVGKRYRPHPPVLSGRGMCVGNPRAVTLLVAMLEAGPTIEAFDMGGNGIDSLEVIQAIAKACTTHPSLTALNLDGNPIPPLAGRTLQRLARSAPRLRAINVANTTIGADQAQQLATALREAEKRRLETAPVAPPGSAGGVPPRPRNILSPNNGASRPLLGAPTASTPTAGARSSSSSHRSRSGRR